MNDRGFKTSLRVRVLCLGLTLSGLIAIDPVQAQAAQRRVFIASDAMDASDFELLEGSLQQLGAALTRLPEPLPECGGVAATQDTGVRVWVGWRPAERVFLCIEDANGRHLRELGPFTALNASAREQLMTVIESGLQAAEEAAATHAQAAAVTPPPPPRAADTPALPAVAAGSKPRTAFSLGLGYAVSVWSSAALAQSLQLTAGFWLLEHELGLGLTVAVVPPLAAERQAPALAMDVHSERVGLWLAKRWHILSPLSLTLALGAALERISVAPSQPTRAALSDARATTHSDPLLTAGAGPSFELGWGLRLALQVGAELLLNPRSYGLTTGTTVTPVLTLARMRAVAMAEISSAW